MRLNQVLEKLKENKLTISIEEGEKLKLRGNKNNIDDELLSLLREHKSE